MKPPEAWIGLPVARTPGRLVRNEELLDRVRASFRGQPEDLERVLRRLRSLFRICGSEQRWLEEEAPLPLAGHAAGVGTEALAAAGMSPEQLDFVIYGSIAREYYEPATASEVAARMGAWRAMPLDITSACAGSLLAAQDLLGRMAMDDDIRAGLVCTSTMTAGHITYDIPTPEALADLGAGLTIGNATTAFLVTRDRPALGGRVVGCFAEGMPRHHDLCRAPIEGHFMSKGVEIFALAQHLPGHVRRLCAKIGWTPADVDVYVSHQPSNRVLFEIARALEVPQERIPQLHGIYGNTAASAVPLTLRHLHDHGVIRPGQKLLLAGAASGFVMASIAVEWEG